MVLMANNSPRGSNNNFGSNSSGPANRGSGNNQSPSYNNGQHYGQPKNPASGGNNTPAVGPRGRAANANNHAHPNYNDAGQGSINGRDPNLDRMGNAFGNMSNQMPHVQSGLPHAQPNESEGMPGDNQGSSGLPDGNGANGRNNPNRSGQNPNGNSGFTDGLKNAGKNLPNTAKNLGSKAKSGMSKVVGSVAGAITSMASRSGIKLSKKKANKMAHVVLSSVAVLLVFLIWYGYDQAEQALPNDPVCSVSNDGDTSYEGTSSTNGAAGDWTQEGTKEYKNAQKLFKYWIKLGFSGAQAAGAVGNVACEGGFTNLDQKEIGGGGGGGLYQFTPASVYTDAPNSDKSWSIKNQTDVLIKIWPGRIKKYVSDAGNDVARAATVFEQDVEIAGVPRIDERIAAAQKAYSLFHGEKYKMNKSKVDSLLGGADEGVATSNSDNAETANNIACGDDSGNDNADTSDIVKTAKALEGYFTYANSRPVPPNVTKDHSSDVKAHDMGSIDKHGTTDCSGYVWLVAKLAGYNPSWYAQTAAMTSAAEQGKGLKKIDEDKTKAGDIAITNGSGDDHTVILLEKYHGKDTKIVNEGGSSNGPVHEETIGTAYGQYWNHYIFARINKE